MIDSTCTMVTGLSSQEGRKEACNWTWDHNLATQNKYTYYNVATQLIHYIGVSYSRSSCTMEFKA